MKRDEEKKGSVLIVDDDRDVLNAARLFLKQHVNRVSTITEPELIPTRLREQSFDAVLLDMNFNDDVSSGEEGFLWLQKIISQDPSVSVILITAYGDVEKAVLAVKKGATDFVLKPWKNEKLLATVHSAIRLAQSKKEVHLLRSKFDTLRSDLEQHYQDMIGASAPMQKVFQTIEKVAKTDANVLITGENGTGKELVARALHRRSNRSENSFISVDMGALPDSLFESELFGHEKGAFTDAAQRRIGRFEVADGGSLFLDEIGNLPLQLQPKLLSAIQTQKIVRIGSNKPIDVDIRLICATNIDLHEKVREQQFRQDLLFRINTIEIHLPPLRERGEDIVLLAEHFLARYCKKYHKENLSLSDNARAYLRSYPWPGNIRELEHAVERAVILSDEEELEPGNFLLTQQTVTDGHVPFEDLNLEEIEKKVVEKALQKHNGNISKAAEDLGLSRTSLYRRMEKYDL